MNGPKLQPNFHIGEDDFKVLVGEGNWKINEIPLNLASGIREHFAIDTSLCVLASGVLNPPISGKADQAIAGIDWVRHEDKPKPGEPDLNVYHFMITMKTDEGYPVFYLASKDTVAPHWSELNDLKVYFKEWK